MDSILSLPELVDLVQQEITINCTLPKVLPDQAVERIITQKATRYFYRYYKYALQRTYYYVDIISMYKNKSTDSKFFYLPNEIEAIKWIYLVNYQDMRNLGYMLPNNSIAFGTTNQAYVASINISEWAESLTVMNALNDAMAMYSKNTVKFNFDPNSKRFEVMTRLDKNLMLEVYAHIPVEALYGDPLFIKWVTGWAYMEYARLIGTYDMPLIGDVKINYQTTFDMGKEMVEKVEEQINKITKSAFIINKTR